MQDDAALMRRVRARDADAFDELYDRNQRLVYGVALRMLGDISAAEDVTQGVFLKIWSSPDSFESGNFSAWIARVSRNACLDILRKKSRPQTPQPPEPEHVEELALTNIDAERVYSALTHLSPEQRELIELAYFGGLTQQGIATRTQLPLGTVKTRIRTGLQKLRALLDERVPV